MIPDKKEQKNCSNHKPWPQITKSLIILTLISRLDLSHRSQVFPLSDGLASLSLQCCTVAQMFADWPAPSVRPETLGHHPSCCCFSFCSQGLKLGLHSTLARTQLIPFHLNNASRAKLKRSAGQVQEGPCPQVCSRPVGLRNVRRSKGKEGPEMKWYVSGGGAWRTKAIA